MVLVAIIAAGTLIDTAGFLQQDAESAGTKSTVQVTDRLSVVHKTGIVTGGGSTVTLTSSDEFDSSLQVSVDDTDGPVDSDSDVLEVADITAADSNSGSCGTPELIVGDEFNSGSFTTSDKLALVRTDGELAFYRGEENGGSIQWGLVGVTDTPGSVRVDDPYTDADCEYTIRFRNATGEEWVVDETGTAEAEFTEGYIGFLEVAVSRGPGAGPINLSQATVTYVGPSGGQTLTRSRSVNNESRFTTRSLLDDDAVLSSEREQVTVVLDTADLASGDGLDPREEVTLFITTSGGGQTRIQVRIPSAYSGQAVVL